MNFGKYELCSGAVQFSGAYYDQNSVYGNITFLANQKIALLANSFGIKNWSNQSALFWYSPKISILMTIHRNGNCRSF
jgi:hypothetical protein